MYSLVLYMHSYAFVCILMQNVFQRIIHYALYMYFYALYLYNRTQYINNPTHLCMHCYRLHKCIPPHWILCIPKYYVLQSICIPKYYMCIPTHKMLNTPVYLGLSYSNFRSTNIYTHKSKVGSEWRMMNNWVIVVVYLAERLVDVEESVTADVAVLLIQIDILHEQTEEMCQS